MDPVLVDIGTGLQATHISAGGWTTCAFTTDDNLTCWGRNNKGQIGNGTTKSSGGVTPTAVTSVPSSFTVRDIDPGGSHMCAASDAGAVWCWGSDAKRQLGTAGDGAAGVLDKLTPTLTDSTGGLVRSVATGDNHSCALRSTGVVVCWGDNTHGQLAQNLATASNSTPTAVSLAAKVTKVAAGSNHVCALTSSGELWCWGSNSLGQVGDGTPDVKKTSPVQVASLGAQVVDVTAGQAHTCALLITAAVKCWGSNSAGQIGAADGLDHSTPVTVDGLDSTATVGSLASSSITSSSATVSGTISVPVGEATYSVERSTTAGFASVAATVQLGTWGTPVSASTSAGHGCVVLTAGTVSCRGSNAYGQLGDGTVVDSTAPVNVVWAKRAVKVSTGAQHSCAVESEGRVWCWGANSHGELGDGTTEPSSNPVEVALDTGERAIDIAAGSTSSCALLDTGSVRCWGSNGAGELGNGSTTPSQSVQTVSLGATAVGISVGDRRACAVMVSGDAMCWGAGMPGDSSTGGTSTPVYAALTSATVRQVVTGSGHSCALLAGGDVKCWGSDETVDMAAPVTVSFGAGTHAVSLAASSGATCALLATGDVSCVGEAGDARIRATHALDPSTVPSHTSRSLSTTFSQLADNTPQWFRFSVSHAGVVSRSSVETFTTDTTTTTTTTTTSTTTTEAPTTTFSATASTEQAAVSTTASMTTIVSTPTTAVTPAQPGSEGLLPQPETSLTSGPVQTSPPVTIAGATNRSAPAVRVIVARTGKSVSAARIASTVGLRIPRGSEGTLRLSIVSGTQRCMFVGSSVRAQRSGVCTVRIVLVKRTGRSTTAHVRISIER